MGWKRYCGGAIYSHSLLITLTGKSHAALILKKKFMYLFEKDFFCAKGIFYCLVYIFISLAETQSLRLPENVGWVERSVTHRLPVRIFTEGYVILPYLSQKRRVFVF